MYNDGLQQQQYLLQLQQQQLQQQRAGTNSPAREFTVVALGKSGEGKSTLLNAILGKELFLAKASVSEVTKVVNQATNHFLNIASNPVIHCIDTPSFNGQLHNPDRVKEIGVLLSKVAGGVDAFLFVVKCTHYRYDNTFHQTLQTYQSMLTPAFWPKVIIVFTHATPELIPSTTESRLQLLAWAREIQESFKLDAPPMTVFAMDYLRFPYPSGGAQEFWEALMTLDANTTPYCHRPFLESFGNGIAVDQYVQRIKGHLALFEPSFFEDQAEGQYNENKRKGSRFNIFRKGTRAPKGLLQPSPSTAGKVSPPSTSGGGYPVMP
ncbi:MAG: AIG1 family-domain-containing protein [Benniella sp.]|nr:MAG: AIG1 family-domain-containing protein [Benniella sp.]